MDLALNNLQRLICHKTQTTNEPEDVNGIKKKFLNYDFFEENSILDLNMELKMKNKKNVLRAFNTFIENVIL